MVAGARTTSLVFEDGSRRLSIAVGLSITDSPLVVEAIAMLECS
jgi:hypothetical protein